jgi:hypothetical protein
MTLMSETSGMNVGSFRFNVRETAQCKYGECDDKDEVGYGSPSVGLGALGAVTDFVVGTGA